SLHRHIPLCLPGQECLQRVVCLISVLRKVDYGLSLTPMNSLILKHWKRIQRNLLTSTDIVYEILKRINHTKVIIFYVNGSRTAGSMALLHKMSMDFIMTLIVKM